MAHPERAFSYLAGVQPAICEALIVPLYDHDGAPLGTVWVVHHEPKARFGADDVLVIERLSPVTAVALKRMQAAHPAAPGDKSLPGSVQPSAGRYGSYRTSGPARGN